MRRKWLLAVSAVVAGVVIVAIWVAGPDDPRVVVGRVGEFPPGSVTAMELDVLLTGHVPEVSDLADGDRVMVPIFLVNVPENGLLALYRRDPHLGCRVVIAADALSDIGVPFPPEVAFVNPCHGETYDLVGRYFAGPSPRGLDRFAVSVVDGDVVVDVMAFEYGPAR